MTQDKKFQDALLDGLVLPKNTWTPVDEALYAPSKLYSIPSQKAEELKFKAIKYSFKHHYTNNQLFNQICKTENVSPDDITNVQDIGKIPLIPDTVFKDYPDGRDFVKWVDQIFTGKLPTLHLKNNNPSYDDVIDG